MATAVTIVSSDLTSKPPQFVVVSMCTVTEWALNNKKILVKDNYTFNFLGDAGKFAWSNQDRRGVPGYRLTLDDDIIYPPDYVKRMVSYVAEYDNKALVGVHCMLFKQPVKRYYALESRYTMNFHFEQTAIDKTVHVIGT